MNSETPVIDMVKNGGGLFDPTYLNLEYFFNKVFVLGHGFLDWFTSFSGGTFFIPFLKAFLSILAILFITGILYTLIRIREIRKEEAKQFHFAEPAASDTKNLGDIRWHKVKELLSSANQSDWRFAILEADTILDELVSAMGYKGENLGERLKTIEKSDFTTLDQAWEAHKIRNRIAHDGSEFVLTDREARRVIALYEEVFQEFEYI